MPDSRVRPWLVGYDITDPRRLQRVNRFLKKHGVPVQYSVFLCRATRPQLKRILAGIDELIDARTDDIRAYPLMESSTPYLYGRQILPEDLLAAVAAPPGVADTTIVGYVSPCPDENKAA